MMPISKPHSSAGGNNTGSSANLVEYLDKENQELDKLALNEKDMEKGQEHLDRKQGFFSHENDHHSKIDVQDTIDQNKRKLGQNDAKFYAPTINFSKKELNHLTQKATNGRKIQNVSEMSKSEFDRYNQSLREYGRSAMNNYAENFNRQEKGLRHGGDLVYFGKIEHQRKYKGTDPEVLNGSAKSGENKLGLQSHIHIIVSRKDKSQRLKLSPVANEKNTKRTIGKNNYTVGFDRKEWITKNERAFDQKFQYQRKEVEKFEVQNTLKNGSPEEKYKIQNRIEKEKAQEMSNNKSLEL
ncbi:DUF5712 family protein [Aquimarina sediminis]|uniref:DUF5712 family protein n=1 Tax=Aquimarina sediminis TaxID=2070536 RepID=UPI000FFF0089|nr:DUF5712 family protein [Aquimarina sediminis]